MNFSTFGKKNHKPLVILHGWGNSGEQYTELAKILGEDFYVLLPDLPGFGKTPPPNRPYDVRDYAKAVRKLLKDQGIEEAIFVGHSFGGRISMKLASKQPKLVKLLILTGAAGVEKFHLKRSLKRAAYWTIAKKLKLFSFLPPVKRMRERFYKNRDFGKVEGVMKETFLKIIKENLTKDAKNIQQHTLLVWGAKDQMTPLYDAEKMHKIIPHNYLKIFTRVGHKLPYEMPHEFAREIVQFVAKY